MRSADCAAGRRPAGARGSVVPAAVHARWFAEVGPVSPSPAWFLWAPERPQRVALQAQEVRARGPAGLRTDGAVRTPSFRVQPVEAKAAEDPQGPPLCAAPLPGLCPRARRGVGLRAVPFDAAELLENNARAAAGGHARPSRVNRRVCRGNAAHGAETSLTPCFWGPGPATRRGRSSSQYAQQRPQEVGARQAQGDP